MRGSHGHAESVRVAELHVTPLNHLSSLIVAKESASNCKASAAASSPNLSRLTIPKLEQKAGSFDLKQLQDDARICRFHFLGPTWP
jgi:hypothetical protein